ncbi:HAD family hydrolase [Nocardiopsis nanhaiensis]
MALAPNTLVFGYRGILTPPREIDHRPHSHHLRQVLDRHGVDLPEAARTDYDQRLATWPLTHARALADLIDLTLTHHQLVCPLPATEVADLVWEQAGDAPIDIQATALLTGLIDEGYRVMVATNTARPHHQRAKHLADAGLGDIALVTSSKLGVAAPNPAFYHHLLHLTSCPAGRVVWVGCDLITDVAGPRAAGMHALPVMPHGAGQDPAGAKRLGAHAVLASVDELADMLLPARPTP